MFIVMCMSEVNRKISGLIWFGISSRNGVKVSIEVMRLMYIMFFWFYLLFS